MWDYIEKFNHFGFSFLIAEQIDIPPKSVFLFRIYSVDIPLVKQNRAQTKVLF